jgi:hypothetical protein
MLTGTFQPHFFRLQQLLLLTNQTRPVPLLIFTSCLADAVGAAEAGCGPIKGFQVYQDGGGGQGHQGSCSHQDCHWPDCVGQVRVVLNYSQA